MSTAVQDSFLLYRNLLDLKNDKYEALVKLSRDLTVDSKRIIFHLHRCVDCSERSKLLEEAEKKLSKTVNTVINKICKQLEGEDIYIYCRAVSAGFQEFVEAYTFYHYLKHNEVPNLQTIEEDVNRMMKISGDNSKQVAQDVVANKEENASVSIIQTDYILGLADLTGELMRYAINCISKGDKTTPHAIRLLLHAFEQAFSSYTDCHREMSVKLSTLRSSLSKVENACYTLTVRGSEIPEHLWCTAISCRDSKHMQDDFDI